MQARKSAHFASLRGVLCALGLSCILSSTALASPITYSYPSAGGSTVDFTNISESPTLASASDQKAHFEAISKSAGPFGAPTASGNSLLFNPTTFSLTVAGPLGADILDSQLSMTIAAKSGYGLDSFSISEAGDVSFPVGGTKATWAQVAASIFVTVTKIDGKAVTPILVPASNAIFIPTGSFNAATYPGTNTWTGNGVIDIADYLVNSKISGTATEINVTLDNTLYAGSSEVGKIAKIQKKLFDGTSFTVTTTPGNPVPEPSSIVLAAMGMLGVGWYGRRQMRRK